MQPIKTIMVTTDFSLTSKKAFPHARSLAEKFEAKVLVVYVEEDRLPPLVLEFTDVGLDHIIERQQERSEQELQRLATEGLGEDLEIETQVTNGSPHVEIVQLARDNGADLIVMATHGRGFISHAILGSTTERVVRHAPCPVLVVRDA